MCLVKEDCERDSAVWEWRLRQEQIFANSLSQHTRTKHYPSGQISQIFSGWFRVLALLVALIKETQLSFHLFCVGMFITGRDSRKVRDNTSRLATEATRKMGQIDQI